MPNDNMDLTNTYRIASGRPPYVIAEIGANHNGDMDLARTMIDAAKECGAHAAKFQSWDNETLIAREEYDRNQSYDDSPKKHFGSLKEMVTKYYLRKEQHRELADYCKSIGIDFISTPFSIREADLLDELDVPFFKVASMDINYYSLLDALAERGKPIVLSTGMATLWEIDKAVERLVKRGADRVVLLHCVSIYPPKYEDINLRNIPMLRDAFGLPVGFSDHTIGYSIPLAAAALGVCIIEKHFTTDKNLPGWDHAISADPEEMRIICQESANIVTAMGTSRRIVSEDEENKKSKFRRSLVAAHDIQSGTEISAEDLTAKRPGTGIPPDQMEFVVGRKTVTDIRADELIKWEALA